MNVGDEAMMSKMCVIVVKKRRKIVSDKRR